MKKLITLCMAATMLIAAVGCSAPAAAPEATAAPAATAAPEAAATPEAAAPEAAPAVDTAKKTSDWTLAYICKDLSQQWFIDESGQMLKVAKELGAKDVIMNDCGMNTEKYLNSLDNMIAQKVDLIFVCPPDQNLSQVTVEKCTAAGIPVIAIDDPLKDEAGNLLAPAVVLSAYDVGQQMGKWLGDVVNKDYDLATNLDQFGYMVMTMESVSSCVPRHLGAMDAFNATVANFPADKMIKADYDGTTEKAYDVAAATITANPQIKFWVVTAPNDEGAMGATRALEAAGKDKDAYVLGAGAYHAKDEFRKEYSAFKAACYFDARVAGETVATIAMDYLKTGKEMCGDKKEAGQQFGSTPFGGVMVDSTNFETVMGEAAK